MSYNGDSGKIEVTASIGDYSAGTQTVTVTITLDDDASTVVDFPNFPTFTLELVDCTPGYHWFDQNSPMTVAAMSGTHTVSIVDSKIPTACTDLAWFSLIFHDYSYVTPSWFTVIEPADK